MNKCYEDLKKQHDYYCNSVFLNIIGVSFQFM